MSHHISVTVGHSPTGGILLLAFGPQPVSFFADAVKVCGAASVVDPDVARMAGATFASGQPSDLALLRERMAPGALQQERVKHSGTASPASLIPGAVEWLAHGERGTSSNALFSRLSGINANRIGYVASHPSDPADLRRCLLMLEACPTLAARLHEAASLSPVWSCLIDAWACLVDALDSEAPNWRSPNSGCSAHKTYALMKRAIGSCA